jgi:BirA family biotin operon repressor/biotin-[acetyl-CoA-carboxylase] ligase
VLTELQPGKSETESVTVVVGIGLNLDTRGQLDGVEAGIGRIADLRQDMTVLPDRLLIAAAIVEQLIRTLMQFESDGFKTFAGQWRRLDWLIDKMVRVETPLGHIEGVASGIDDDGALIVQRGGRRERIVSGTVTLLPANARRTGTGNG